MYLHPNELLNVWRYIIKSLTDVEKINLQIQVLVNVQRNERVALEINADNNETHKKTIKQCL